MTRTTITRTAAAAFAGGLLVLGGAAVSPALAYPPGTALTIACTPGSVAPGGAVTCVLTNINPAGPNSIVFGDLVASGGVSFSLASVAAQESTSYSQTLTAPATPGKYEVMGKSADETVTTTVTVTHPGAKPGAGAGKPGTGTTTPATGANTMIGLAAGLGALAVGGGLYGASRRKKV